MALTEKASGTGYWGYNDFLGLGYRAQLTKNLVYDTVPEGYTLVNIDQMVNWKVFLQLEVHATGYRGFFVRTGGDVLIHRRVIDFDTQSVKGVIEIVVEATLGSGAWMGVWYNSDSESGATSQPRDHQVDWYVRQSTSANDYTSAVPTHPPYRAITSRDLPTDENNVSHPLEEPPAPEPVDTGSGTVTVPETPAQGRYAVYAILPDYSGYDVAFQLYHQYFGAYPTPLQVKHGITLTPGSSGDGTMSLYQTAPDGDGWITIEDSRPGWRGAGAEMGWRMFWKFKKTTFRSRTAWLIGDGSRWIAAPNPSTYQGTSYNSGARDTYPTAYTSDTSLAALFLFDGY